MDLVTELRRAELISLKHDAVFTALVPAASIYSQVAPANPAWPHTKQGAPSGIPTAGACYTGANMRWTRHVFAGPRYVDGDPTKPMLETVEDHIGRIIAALKDNLHRARLPITGGFAKLRCINEQRLIDNAEASQMHAIIDFRVKVMTALAA